MAGVAAGDVVSSGRSHRRDHDWRRRGTSAPCCPPECFLANRYVPGGRAEERLHRTFQPEASSNAPAPTTGPPATGRTPRETGPGSRPRAQPVDGRIDTGRQQRAHQHLRLGYRELTTIGRRMDDRAEPGWRQGLSTRLRLDPGQNRFSVRTAASKNALRGPKLLKTMLPYRQQKTPVLTGMPTASGNTVSG